MPHLRFISLAGALAASIALIGSAPAARAQEPVEVPPAPVVDPPPVPPPQPAPAPVQTTPPSVDPNTPPAQEPKPAPVDAAQTPVVDPSVPPAQEPKPAPVEATPPATDPNTPPVQEPKPTPTPVDPNAPTAQPPKPAPESVVPTSTPAQPVKVDSATGATAPKPQDPAPTDPAVPPTVPPPTNPVPAPPVVEPAPANPPAVLAAPTSPRDFASVQAALDKLVADHASLAKPLELGATTDGRKVPAILFGAEGPVALETRPCVLLLGALDGESPTGGLAVLQISAELLREPASLPAGVSFAAVPWSSPEAIELTQQGKSADGRNTRPVDEDRDGRVDEDGADDLDGDGAILQMLVEDPEGPWTRPENQRLLARARPGDAPRYSLTLEGKDDDGDGLFNEDGPGGVVLDLNFPVGRVGPWQDNLGGVLPLSESLSRNYADFALVRKAAIVLVFQGSHGRLAIPGGTKSSAQAGWMPEVDRNVFERAYAAFVGATSRRNLPLACLLECRGRERRGAAIDWFYSVAGALAIEIAPWGPVLDAPAENGAESARKTLDGVSAEDQAWARWLDDTRGGLGFVDWHPVDLGARGPALVGGFEPGVRTNPPPESLAKAFAGLADFARRVSASLPHLELRVSEASRDGEVVRIRARVANAGALPTGLSISDRRVGAVGAWLKLELPAGAKLIAGSERCTLARLVGGGISRECEWIVVAPAGSKFSLSAGGDWAVPIGQEVQP